MNRVIMCIFIDANVFGQVFAEPVGENALPIHNWLNSGNGKIAYSTDGRFASEISNLAKVKLNAFAQAGRAKVIPAKSFLSDENALRRRVDLRSDDPHILALARASGARLLYTADKDLKADFKSKRFIDKPRGRIYSTAGNANLLTKSVCAS